MELLTESKVEHVTDSKSRRENPIPVMGIESSIDSFDESIHQYGDENYCRTAECAYYKAEARGFVPGHEMDDWLAAESELNQ